MVSFIFRRIGLMIVVLFLVSVIIFSLVNILPGDPALMILGQDSSPEAIESLREELGLNKPLIQQYTNWMGNVLMGDLGESLNDNTGVTTLLMKKIPITMQLAVMSLLISIIIAIPAGILGAAKKGTFWDYISTTMALSGVALPPFWIGILLIFIFSITLGWLPPSGYVSFFEDPWRNILLMLMPAFALGIRSTAELTRMLRSSMVETLQSDFVRTGYAKGLMGMSVVFKHAFRNSLIPVITMSGLQLAALLGGVVIVETIFHIPGLGQLIYNAILERDFPVVQGGVLFIAFGVIIINFIVDIIYSLVDPRIKLGGQK